MPRGKPFSQEQSLVDPVAGNGLLDRRFFLKQSIALGAGGLAAVSTLPAHAADLVGPKNSNAPFPQHLCMRYHSLRILLSPWPYPILRLRKRGGGRKGRWSNARIGNHC